MTVRAICELATNGLEVMAGMMIDKAEKIGREDSETACKLILAATKLRRMAEEIGGIGGDGK